MHNCYVHRLRLENARGPVSDPEDGVGEEGDASGLDGGAAEAPKIVSNTESTTPCERGAEAAGAGSGALGAAAAASGAMAAFLDAAIVELTRDEPAARGALVAAAAAVEAGAAVQDICAVGASARATDAAAAEDATQETGESGTGSTPRGAAVVAAGRGSVAFAGAAVEADAADAVTGFPAGFLVVLADAAGLGGGGFAAAAAEVDVAVAAAAVRGAEVALRAAFA